MGTPLPHNEPGVQCSNCWGAGAKFGDTETPKYIRCRFSGIVVSQAWLDAGGFDPNRDFILEQQAAPCTWQQVFPGGACTVIYNFYNTEILLQIDLTVVFTKLSASLCLSEADNDYFYPGTSMPLGGKVEILWDMEGL